MEQAKLFHHTSGPKSLVTSSSGAARHCPRRTSFSDKRGKRLLFQISLIIEVFASPNYFVSFSKVALSAPGLFAPQIFQSADAKADVADGFGAVVVLTQQQYKSFHHSGPIFNDSRSVRTLGLRCSCVSKEVIQSQVNFAREIFGCYEFSYRKADSSKNNRL